MNRIDHAQYERGGIEIIHEGDQEDNFIVEEKSVRGGILWPAESPGYLCVLGQRHECNAANKKPLVLLDEHVCDLPQQLIEAICEESRRLFCRDLFCDYNDSTYRFIEDLDRHVKTFRFGNVNLDAPHLTDWINGVLSAQQWMADEALEVPESILREQLADMTPEDRQESQRGKLFAVDALRTVIGSFEQPPPRPAPIIKKSGYFYG